MDATIHGTMTPRATDYPLKKPRPIKWRASDDDYELVMRELHDEGKKLTEKEHELWFGDGRNKKRRLEALRKKQRAAGIPDSDFRHTDAQ